MVSPYVLVLSANEKSQYLLDLVIKKLSSKYQSPFVVYKEQIAVFTLEDEQNVWTVKSS